MGRRIFPEDSAGGNNTDTFKSFTATALKDIPVQRTVSLAGDDQIIDPFFDDFTVGVNITDRHATSSYTGNVGNDTYYSFFDGDKVLTITHEASYSQATTNTNITLRVNNINTGEQINAREDGDWQKGANYYLIIRDIHYISTPCYQPRPAAANR